MMFQAEQGVFAAALAAISRTANSRATTDAVGGVLVEASKRGVLVLTGTDGYTTLRLAVPAQVSERGTALMPVRRLTDIVRAMESSVTIETLNNKARVTSGMFIGMLPLMPVGNFPALNQPEGSKFVIDGTTLASAVSQVLPAASVEEAHAAMTSLLVVIKDGTLTLAATDGVRLAERRVAVDSDLDVRVLIHRSAFVEFARPAVVNEREVTITFGDTQTTFAVPGCVLTSTNVEAVFPDYESKIPSDAPQNVRADRRALLGAVSRVSLMSDIHVPVRAAFIPRAVALSCRTAGVGEAEESVPATLEGESLAAAFNPEYLVDALEGVRSDTVHIAFESPLKPFLFTGDDDYRHVLMPVRVAR